MIRTCFVCGKPLPIEKRATVYCSLRCQELDARLRPVAAPRPPKPQPGNARSPWRGPGR